MDLMDVGAWCVILTKRLTELLSYENWIKLVPLDLFGLVAEGYIIPHALHAWEFAPT